MIKPLTICAIVAAINLANLSLASPGSSKESAIARRERRFDPLPLGQIKPRGWLERQLEIQLKGLSGSLDEFWPDIKNSAWTGGASEGWERAPYWLDGAVPLAYLTDDPTLKGKVSTFIDYVLTHQHADGWLGPVSDGKHPEFDPWPLFVLFKALTQYQEASGDPRVIPAMLKCAKKIDEVVSKKPLFSWGQFRSADLCVSLAWLYDRTHEEWLLDLSNKALKQGFDWKAHLANYPFKTRVEKDFGLDSHGVNTAMGLKFPAVRWLFGGVDADKTGAGAMLGVLDRLHGQATGVFTCDEHVAGRSPSQGTELCTVVEEAYSLETALAISGEPMLGDRLERIVFNALPATFKPDMTAHQYDQQANQVICTYLDERPFASNGPDANLFGLEPNFGCCTANMHQGWPKFAAHLVMKPNEGGLAVVAYAPCRVETKVGEAKVTLDVETDYPFSDHIVVRLSTDREAAFPLYLRIPAWCRSAEIEHDGQTRRGIASGTFEKVEKKWSGTMTVTLTLPMNIGLVEGYEHSAAIECGPLVYALEIGAFWKKVKDNPKFADWEVFPTTPWNYALQIDRDRPDRSIALHRRGIGEVPFSAEGAGTYMVVQGRLIAWWTIKKNAAAPPASPLKSDSPLVPLVLKPYGATTLRITEFPVLANE